MSFQTSALRFLGLSLLLTGSVHAVAAVPTLTAMGTFESAPVYQGQTPAYFNLASLNGKPFILELGFLDMPVYQGSEAIPELPGEVIHVWTPGSIQYKLTVDGNVLFSGTSSSFTSAEAIDDITIPAGFLANLPPDEILPPLVQEGNTYDNVLIDVSGIPLGCIGSGPQCDQPGDIFEGLTLNFEYVWDTASKNAITGLPGNPALIPADFFSGGQGVVGVSVWHYDGVDGNDIAIHGGITSTVALAMPVPEAETYAMMLAGLGLVGFMVMRRRNAR